MSEPRVLADLGSGVSLERLVPRIGPIAVLGDPAGVAVSDVAFRHADVRPGALFCCVPGERHDGHDFALEARRTGAVAFVCEHSLAGVGGAVQLVVPPGEVRPAMARASCAFYGDPASSLRTIGVTGTNGKTTTTYLLRAILELHGWATGVVGTLDGARTTPESPDLQRALARFRDGGCSAAAIEVTSHALVQSRVDGITFDVAVFTNLSQDHLDYHKTMEAYFAAKAELFTPERSRLGVVNGDDPYGRRLSERAAVETVVFSLDEAESLVLEGSTSRFLLRGHEVTLKMAGAFNVMNALAAAAAARALGVGDSTVAQGLAAAPPVPGRFERIDSIDGVSVVVDYAHTPAALEQVLTAARRLCDEVPASTGTGDRAARRARRAGRLVVVLGAGGERDRGKRPAMGATAARLADLVVLTSDNPRGEDPAVIADQVRAGIPPNAAVRVELDRREAIGWALAGAAAGDVVVVAGKGHETTQQFSDRLVRFDDREVVRELLEHQGRLLPGWMRPGREGGED